jgi:hypothetical protein
LNEGRIIEDDEIKDAIVTKPYLVEMIIYYI